MTQAATSPSVVENASQSPDCETSKQTSEETIVTADTTVNSSSATSIGKGPAPHEPMSRPSRDLVLHPRKGSTAILLDDDLDDEAEVPPDRQSGGSRYYGFAELVKDGAELDKRRQQNLEKATAKVRYFHRDFSRAVVSKMNVYHHPRKGDRHLIVIDHAIPVPIVGDLFQGLLQDRFRRTEFARPDTRQYKHHLVEYDLEDIGGSVLSQMVSALVQLCFPSPAAAPLEVYRVYTNAVLFGDVAFMHRDSDSGDHVTALLYPNLTPEWRAEFGGETVFYDEDREIIDAVEPRPGRLCLFTGSLLHKGSPPGRLVYESRFTTAFKFSPAEREEQQQQQQQPGRQVMMRRPTGGNDPEPEPQ